MREEAQDRSGNTIHITDERWQHIYKSHPQLRGRRHEILSTLRSGKRIQYPSAPGKFYYYKPFRFNGKFKLIEVVVLFRRRNHQPNNYVVTAYPR